VGFTITIESIAFGGEGVGHIDNLVVFVPFSAITKNSRLQNVISDKKL